VSELFRSENIFICKYLESKFLLEIFEVIKINCNLNHYFIFDCFADVSQLKWNIGKMSCSEISRNWDSVVGITTGYELDD
jgi:hypothetical protein